LDGVNGSEDDLAKLWVKPGLRPMNGANQTAVQQMLRHGDPKITTELHGYLSPDYLRDEIDRLQFGPAVARFASPVLPGGSGSEEQGRRLLGETRGTTSPLAQLGSSWAVGSM
jgi:hypothetical protein